MANLKNYATGKTQDVNVKTMTADEWRDFIPQEATWQARFLDEVAIGVHPATAASNTLVAAGNAIMRDIGKH